MSETMDMAARSGVVTTPDSRILPKRNGQRGLLPSTWLERTLRIQYVDASGLSVETSGVLLDVFPFGPVLSLSGAKTALSWDALRVVELVED